MSTPTTPTLAPGEIYAGPVLAPDGSTTHHLVLLPSRPAEKLDWQAAKAWAASVGGELPSRQEQALLLANCKPHLPTARCWSSEEYEEDASYAWACYFFNGDQGYYHKSFQGSAVAVRRSILESFGTSDPDPDPGAEAAASSRAQLDRRELDHMRKMVDDLTGRLDAARQHIGLLQDELQQAWATADSWQEAAADLARDPQGGAA